MSMFPLATERLALRPFRQTDLAAFTAYRTHPEVERYQSWSSCTDDEAAAFLAEQQQLAFDTDGTWFQLAVERQHDGVLLGDVAVHFFNDGQQAEIGMTFDVAAQRQGYALEAVARVVECLFDGLRKHRIVATVDTRNLRAQRLLERQGFRREAHFHKNIHFKGSWSDEYAYALLNSEWRSSREGPERGVP